ncbi:phosphatidylinositol-glycan biosynthesis class X protein [Diabrotica undecimpunctata]|uniref:phosphatidylinositol-glycan biosynthesis class X protein n=1 Tax=Diabrotica undecimpunctata TaxID=50387 RepID=UPI003B63C870
MSKIWVFTFLFILLLPNKVKCNRPECIKLKTAITQNIENNGFHRDIWWLVETSEPSTESWLKTECNLALRLDVSRDMFVNPDEIAELNRTGELQASIDGKVNVEIPAHEADEHILYVFLNSSLIKKLMLTIPIHLRYQRSQITGGFGKVNLRKPSLLMWCPNNFKSVCNDGLKVEAPCDEKSQASCVWKNISYLAHFEDAELFVPVGDLDHYPLVSILTLLLGCAGCIYILSVLSTTSM